MYDVLMGYLERLPGAMQENLPPSGESMQVCVYSPHSLRATTVTLLLDAREPIATVEDLLDHKHITTT
jgi:integrase